MQKKKVLVVKIQISLSKEIRRKFRRVELSQKFEVLRSACKTLDARLAIRRDVLSNSRRLVPRKNKERERKRSCRDERTPSTRETSETKRRIRFASRERAGGKLRKINERRLTNRGRKSHGEFQRRKRAFKRVTGAIDRTARCSPRWTS